MDLPTDTEEVSAQMYNNYCCRFCVYDANGSLDCLQAHYTEHHPVTVEKIGEERIDYYQAGQLIALLSKNHKHCCFENCPNNQTLTLRKNLLKLAVQLKYGGLYPQLTPFFDEEHYNTEPHVFSCCDLFHHSKFYSSDVLLRWITQYGLIRTFSLKDIVKKKKQKPVIVAKSTKGEKSGCGTNQQNCFRDGRERNQSPIVSSGQCWVSKISPNSGKSDPRSISCGKKREGSIQST